MNAIEIEQLSWKYSGAAEMAVRDIHLAIPEKTFTGIIGPNGAGKTTLVSSIRGIIPNNYSGVYRGSVQLFGKEVRDIKSAEFAEQIGVVFADPDSQFTAMSVEEEIAFGLENIGCPVETIRERLEWVSSLTGIESLMSKPPYDLSGGQKQRVAIASVLATQPRIVILDEPTSMLDPVSKDYVFSLLQKMKEEMSLTIIVVEHNIEKLVELSDNLLLMDGGHIVKYGPVDTFFDDVDLVRGTGVKIPGAIDLVHRIAAADGTQEPLPVRFAEIRKWMENKLTERGGRCG